MLRLSVQKSRRNICAILFAVLVSLTAISAVQAQQSVDNSITLKLKALSEKACLGSIVTLEMTLTNDGQSDVKLSVLEIWSSFGINSVDSDGKKREAFLGVVPGIREVYDRMQNTIVTLSPGSPFVTTYKLGLVDARVFDSPLNYQIRSVIFYNNGLKAWRSNFASVEVVDCKTNKLEQR